MSDMKCPFCQQELEIGGVDGILRGCPKCRNLGTEILWQELIRTCKALQSIYDYTKIVSSELAKNHLGQFQKPISKIGDMAHIALKAEQKDVK